MEIAVVNEFPELQVLLSIAPQFLGGGWLRRVSRLFRSDGFPNFVGPC